MSRFLRLMVPMLIGMIVMESVAWACPNCRDGLASDPSKAGLVRGFFWSIVFLVSMPFLIFACLSGYFYWLIRSARNVAPQSLSTGPVDSPNSAMQEAESLEVVS